MAIFRYDKRKAGATPLLIPLLGAFGLAHYSRMSKVESPAKYVYATSQLIYI